MFFMVDPKNMSKIVLQFKEETHTSKPIFSIGDKPKKLYLIKKGTIGVLF